MKIVIYHNKQQKLMLMKHLGRQGLKGLLILRESGLPKMNKRQCRKQHHFQFLKTRPVIPAALPTPLPMVHGEH